MNTFNKCLVAGFLMLGVHTAHPMHKQPAQKGAALAVAEQNIAALEAQLNAINNEINDRSIVIDTLKYTLLLQKAIAYTESRLEAARYTGFSAQQEAEMVYVLDQFYKDSFFHQARLETVSKMRADEGKEPL